MSEKYKRPSLLCLIVNCKSFIVVAFAGVIKIFLKLAAIVTSSKFNSIAGPFCQLVILPTNHSCIDIRDIHCSLARPACLVLVE